MKRTDLMILSEVAEILNYSTSEACINWCKTNDVTVYYNVPGKAVCAIEFEIAVNKPLIDKLKAEFGDTKWEQAYRHYKTKNITGIISFKNKSDIAAPEYEPTSQAGKAFLKD